MFQTVPSLPTDTCCLGAETFVGSKVDTLAQRRLLYCQITPLSLTPQMLRASSTETCSNRPGSCVQLPSLLLRCQIVSSVPSATTVPSDPASISATGVVIPSVEMRFQERPFHCQTAPASL